MRLPEHNDGDNNKNGGEHGGIKDARMKESNASTKMLKEAMDDAQKFKQDIKNGNSAALEQDAHTLNQQNNPQLDAAVQQDLHNLGFPDVTINGFNGPDGKPFTDIIVGTQGKNGTDTLTTYWAGDNGPNDGPNSVGKESVNYTPTNQPHANFKWQPPSLQE